MEKTKKECNSQIKFAGSITFGKAPHPKDLPIPKFIKNMNIYELNKINIKKDLYFKNLILR